MVSFSMACDRLSNRSKGVLYSVAGVMALTPDSLLIRLCAGVPNQTVLFYRNIIFGTAMLIGLIVTEKWNAWNKLKALGKWGLFTGVIFGASLWFIIVGIQKTAAANVLVIQAANPVFAAIFSWFIMREALSKITLATSAVCVVAIILIFIGNVNGDSSNGSDNTAGLLYAVASSVSFGLYMVMLRWLSVFQTSVVNRSLPGITVSDRIVLYTEWRSI
jgi:drug/metabolite transporter (DMT)-like permease